MRHSLGWSTSCHRHSSACGPSLVLGSIPGEGEQYIDRRRRAVQWTECFAPTPADVSLSCHIWRVCGSAVIGPPLNRVTLIAWRDCSALSDVERPMRRLPLARGNQSDCIRNLESHRTIIRMS